MPMPQEEYANKKKTKKKELQNNLLGQVRNVRKIDPVDRQFAFFQVSLLAKKTLNRAQTTETRPEVNDHGKLKNSIGSAVLK